MLRWFKTRHLFGMVIIGLLLNFQNCSMPADQNFLETEQSNLPFAYEPTVDTLAYMSCSEMASTYNQNAYFTLRVGAFNGGAGLSLTQNFLSATQGYTSDLRGQAFSESNQNMGTNLQLAVRAVGNYQEVLSGNGTAVDPGEDINSFLMELDDNPIASQLGALQAGEWQNNFQGNDNYYANQNPQMVSSLAFVESETTASSMRAQFGNTPQAILTLTFPGTTDPSDYSARSPEGAVGTAANGTPGQDTNTFVYGTGYLLQFTTPYGWSNSDARVLAGVEEEDLSGMNLLTTQQAWNCSDSNGLPMEFIIVQPSDVYPGTGANILCNEQPDDPSALSAVDQQTLKSLRNVLPVSDWYVDMQHRCVVPYGAAVSGGANCYGDATGIDYTSTACTPFTQNSSGATLGNCPHWVSLCTRQ